MKKEGRLSYNRYVYRLLKTNDGRLNYKNVFCILMGIHVWAEIKGKLQEAETSCIHSPLHAFWEPAFIHAPGLGMGVRHQSPGAVSKLNKMTS